MDMNTIAITGANGQLGTSLLSRLADGSHQNVRALVRSDRALKKIESLEHQPAPDIRVVDYASRSKMTEALEGVSCVVHLVGIIKEGAEARYVDSHEGTCEVLAAAATAVGVQRIVYLSILGSSPEAANACLLSKGRAERILLESEVPTAVIRVPMVVGGDDPASASLRRQAQSKSVRLIGGGATLQQPIDSRDVVTAVLAAASLKSSENLDLDVGGPECLSHRDLVLRSAKLWGNEPQIRSLPESLARLAVRILEKFHPNPPVTHAMFDILQHDDQTDPGIVLAKLGVELTPLNQTLADYIGPGGQSTHE